MFRWIFILADVKKPILGADFLRHFGLLVDMRNHRLLDKHTLQCISTQTPFLPQCYHATRKWTSLPLYSLNSQRSMKVHNYHDCSVKHNVTLYIITTSPPVTACTYLLAPPSPGTIIGCTHGVWAYAQVGHHKALIQSSRKVKATGDLTIQSHTYRIFQHLYMEPPYFPS